MIKENMVCRALLLSAIAVILVSCNAVRYVPDGNYLLNKQKMVIQGKDFTTKELNQYVRQRPNNTTAWLPIPVWLYSASNLNKNNWFHRKLRLFGEAPVIFDSIRAEIGAQQIANYIMFRGFYDGNVSVEVKKRGKKANVVYRVVTGKPYYIRNIAYDIQDPFVDTSFVIDHEKTLIHSGERFDGNVLDAETNRIASIFRENGYYHFNKNFITFAADTSIGNRQVDITVILQQDKAHNNNGEARPHRRFEINDIIVNANYDHAESSTDSGYWSGWDTIKNYGFKQIYKDVPVLKPNVTAIYNKIESGCLYNEADVNMTYDNFAHLRLFQSINIRFMEEFNADSVPVADNVAPEPAKLNAIITMTPQTLMNYRLRGDISFSGKGLWGIAAQLAYQHKNLFRGAEIFDLNFNTIFQKIQWKTDAKPQNSMELSADMSINVPQFSMPLNLKLYRSVISPRTMASISVNYQMRPDYVRWLSSFGFGYSWQRKKNLTYILTPIDIHLINVKKTNETAFFDSFHDNPYLMSAYQNTFIMGAVLTGVYNTQKSSARDYSYLRADIETKGNLLQGIYSLAGIKKVGEENDKYHDIFSTRFAQYVRLNVNYVLHREISDNTDFAMRGIFALGYAYGNSNAMPFDKMYYAGGPYSLRGWQIRGVGPGKYDGGENDYIINRIANMRAEFNAEYRFKILQMLEGALFVDVGNIWSADMKDNREGARFAFKDLHQSIAADWGLGLRFSVGVFVLRLDFGMQIHDPAQRSPYFVAPSQWFFEKSAIIFGLGYPF
jgi:outer membrane protein assembly factor BamA